MNRKLKSALCGIVAFTFLAACSSPQPPPLAVAPSPPPLVVKLAPHLIEQASAYRAYMDRAVKITPDFADGASIAKGLEVGETYEPSQLVRDAIAYGAIAALQDRAFVAGIRTFGSGVEQRRQIAYEILKNPTYVAGLPGATSAAGLVVQALGGDGQRLYDGGKAVKQSAYDLQKQPWSKIEVADREGRLARAKALSKAPILGDLAQTNFLQQASVGAASLGLNGAPVAGPYSQVVTRSLAVAALAILGEAGDDQRDSVNGIMDDPNVTFCMSMAKLNLYQCLAVSRPNYEDIFCLGQHVMMDTGRCVIKASGLAEPYEAKFVPVVRSDIGYNMPKKVSRKVSRKKR